MSRVLRRTRLAVILAVLGAANALANPKRLLRSVPGALYEVGMALVVALTFAPQLVEVQSGSAGRDRLRGRGPRRSAALAASPCRCSRARSNGSLDLAAAMDSRASAGADRRAGPAPVRPAL